MEREFYYSKDGTKVLVVASVGELESINDRINRFKYKYDHMLVIGNGFDLNLGLATTYRNFIESCIFKKMYVKRIQEKRNFAQSTPSLIDYLYGKKFYEHWYDIEQALLEYVSKRPDGSFVNNIQVDKKDYELVCNTLVAYLVSLFQTGDDLKQSQRMKNSSAGQLLKRMSSKRDIIYSFNYTPINLIKDAIFSHYTSEAVRVHGRIKEETIFKGNIKDNSIILGIETDVIRKIAPGYSFLLKSNSPNYKSTCIASDLLRTKHVIFFGHSLNEMDFGYFREYFHFLTSNINNDRKITLITKDKESRVILLDNLRNAGISVRDLFAHTNVEIILTEDIKISNSESSNLFNVLLEDLEMNRY